MPEPTQNPADPEAGETRPDADGAPGAPSADESSSGGPQDDAHEPEALPGAVTTAWSSIFSSAYRRLGQSRRAVA